MHKKIIILFVIAAFLLPGLLLAETGARREVEIQIQELPEVTPLPLNDQEDEDNDDGIGIRELPERVPNQARETIRETINFSEKRDQLTQEIRERTVATQERAGEMKQEALSVAQERRERFQERLDLIRDEARRTRAEVLAQNIERLNENLSNRYIGYLDALELILSKIESRVALVEDLDEEDSDYFYGEIDFLKGEIDQVREVIIAQKSKVYIVDLQSEETTREDFRITMEELRNDHREIREEFIDPLRERIRSIFSILSNL